MYLNSQNCGDLKSETYRDLCNTLSLEPASEPTTRAFTGLPATDIMILDILSDEDLINTCRTNKYLNDLCNNESFWMNRTVSKYGYILGSIEDIYLYIPPGTSWKEYYLWLSDLNKNILNMLYIEENYNRPDLTLILDRPVYIGLKVMHGLPYGFLANSHSITTRRQLALNLLVYIPNLNNISEYMLKLIYLTVENIKDDNELTDKQRETLRNPVIINKLRNETRILNQRRN
jgi:hypothetical protein